MGGNPISYFSNFELEVTVQKSIGLDQFDNELPLPMNWEKTVV